MKLRSAAVVGIFSLLITALFLFVSCGSEGEGDKRENIKSIGKPSSIGVFIKNPGEDFVMVVSHDFRSPGVNIMAGEPSYLFTGIEQPRDEARDYAAFFFKDLPLLKHNGKLILYGLDIDHSRIHLGWRVTYIRMRSGDVGGFIGKVCETPEAVQKAADDMYVIEFPESRGLWTGSYYLNTGSENDHAWFFNYQSSGVDNLIGDWQPDSLSKKLSPYGSDFFFIWRFDCLDKDLISFSSKMDSWNPKLWDEDTVKFAGFPVIFSENKFYFSIASEFFKETYRGLGLLDTLTAHGIPADSVRINGSYDATNDALAVTFLGSPIRLLRVRRNLAFGFRSPCGR